jgi:hypothetical protein
MALALACSSAGPGAATSAAPPHTDRPESAAANSEAAADGSSAARAVVVPRDTEREGVAWEYGWIREHYGEYKRKEQGLVVNQAGRTLDRITVQLSDGTEKTFYFDITRYFGRF